MKAISLFTGCGGFDIGFEKVGFSTKVCVEINPVFCETLEFNQPRYFNGMVILNRDIKTVSGAELLDMAQLDNVDVVFGGSPCQSFSVANSSGVKGTDDPRGLLIYEFVRLIKEIKPKAFVFENVLGLLQFPDVFNDVCKQLECDGYYKITAHEYNMAYFGVPQFRRRVFIVGGHSEISRLSPTHDEPGSFFCKPFVTVEDAFKGLAKDAPNNIGRDHTDNVRTMYSRLSWGQRPSHSQLQRLHPSKPSYTIVGNDIKHVHPKHHRKITLREAACLQTFPNDFVFKGSFEKIINQIGNAVPPLFAEILANHIKKELLTINS